MKINAMLPSKHFVVGFLICLAALGLISKYLSGNAYVAKALSWVGYTA